MICVNFLRKGIYSLTVFAISIYFVFNFQFLKIEKAYALPGCGVTCSSDSGSSSLNCSYNTSVTLDGDDKACVVNPNSTVGIYGRADCQDTTNGIACTVNKCPDYFIGIADGAQCQILDSVAAGLGCSAANDLIPGGGGKWDADNGRCIKCNGKLQNTSYTIGSTSPYNVISTTLTSLCDAACDASVSTACDEHAVGYTSGGYICNSSCAWVPVATATVTTIPTPTPGGDFIRFGGTYQVYDCATSTLFGNPSAFNGTSGGSCISPGTWTGCGDSTPSSGSYDCFVGLAVDCSNPLKRCSDRYYAATCECVIPAVTATVTASVTATPVGLLGCSCPVGIVSGCPAIGTMITCSLTDSTVNTFCTANPGCRLVMPAGLPNCDCASLLAATPTASVTGSVTATGSSATCNQGDGCKLGCLPQDPDCASAGCTVTSSGVTICNPTLTNSFDMLVQNVTGWILGIIGSLALLFLIIGGIMYIGAGGDQDRIKTAKTIVTAVVIGLIVVIASYSIINEIKKILGY